MKIPVNSTAYKVIGCAMRVHKELGNGFLEAVYADALAIELKKCGIPFEREKEIVIFYCGEPLNVFYKADLICNNELIVELKATQTISSVHIAQTLNYLKATHLKEAVVINFGQPSLHHEYLTEECFSHPKKNAE